MQEFHGELSPVEGAYAIVVSRYNEMITGKLLEGAIGKLRSAGVAEDAIYVAHVPGAWELPVVAQTFAEDAGVAAVLCLGAVIKGETTHDQYINQQVAESLGRLALERRKPVLFGLLTCNTMEQAINRAGGRVGNKGEECAEAALEMAHLMQQLRDRS